ncbi:hypothetical protein L210DRAFT_3477944 [Boletus edulis BED1]|uniref:F-box domain-containing protein n=1 Tax=Boletus edulis BED1 TaxID=1328754 RepID=A0AAD4BWZ4_BOLED|nr:hypothetical protein L210DRAFT_3477944 [Boletus edulis BED1]
MSRSSFSLENLVTHYPSILDDIALYLAVDPFLGPPVNLSSLLLTCRTLYDHLSIANNCTLYARIFRYKFDCGAIERRLTPRWTSARCLARELRSRFIALQHIKHGNPSLRADREALWKAYLMLLENDGRNAGQLLDWANLRDWVLAAVALRSFPSPTNTCHPTSHLSDPMGVSLAMWLLWMTSSKESVAAEAVRVRTALTNAILPFLVRGYQYPSVFAPDTYFYLPLCEEHDESPGFSGPLPLVAHIHYLGHKLKLAVPPLTSAALLNFVVRQEAWQDTVPLSPRIASLPATREEATTRDLGTPALTQEDVREFHFHTRTRFFQHDRAITSGRLDRDWFRLVACHTPSAVERPLKGILYSLGTLVGTWTGRIFVPDVIAYLNAVTDQRRPAASVPLVQERISCCFEEHHCLSFSEPLIAPPRHDGLGEDVFNAWLPQDFKFTRRTDGLEIFDPSTGKNTWYETYRSDRRSPYSTKACELLSKTSVQEWCHQDASDPAMQQDTEEVDEYEDFVEELPSGVQDIIITGETPARQGEAWGCYSYIGRIRPWDGLVVFLRIPMNDPDRRAGRWIFKGYVHERSIVGRWRDTATDEHVVGFEGGFVLCQEDEVNTAPVFT